MSYSARRSSGFGQQQQHPIQQNVGNVGQRRPVVTNNFMSGGQAKPAATTPNQARQMSTQHAPSIQFRNQQPQKPGVQQVTPIRQLPQQKLPQQPQTPQPKVQQPQPQTPQQKIQQQQLQQQKPQQPLLQQSQQVQRPPLLQQGPRPQQQIRQPQQQVQRPPLQPQVQRPVQQQQQQQLQKQQPIQQQKPPVVQSQQQLQQQKQPQLQQQQQQLQQQQQQLQQQQQKQQQQLQQQKQQPQQQQQQQQLQQQRQQQQVPPPQQQQQQLQQQRQQQQVPPPQLQPPQVQPQQVQSPQVQSPQVQPPQTQPPQTQPPPPPPQQQPTQSKAESEAQVQPPQPQQTQPQPMEQGWGQQGLDYSSDSFVEPTVRKKPFWARSRPQHQQFDHYPRFHGAARFRRTFKRRPGGRRFNPNSNPRFNKALQPKNAVMILNELVKNTSYIIEELPVKIDTNQFKATVCYEGVEHIGYGPSKNAAKNAAAETALRHYVQTNKITTNIKEDNEGNEKMEVSESETTETPWEHIASFALYKLFCSWGQDPNVVKDCWNPPTLTAESGAAPMEVQYEKKPAKKMPPNPEEINPLMLMNQMLPTAEFEDLGKTGVDPNVNFSFKCTVDEQSFIGIGSNKKAAKRNAAFQVCNKILAINYPPEIYTPSC